jgi:hypothetical protein
LNKQPLMALVAVLAMLCLAPLATAADQGNTHATLSFFSSGSGAHAGWVHTNDQPAIDTDYSQAIQIHTTATGYAGVLVHHVYGTPTASFPNSSFDFKAATPGPSLGSPRLVILFSDGGRAELRPLVWTTDWQKVADPNWDDNGGTCGFVYETTWNTVQACHAGTFIANEYITTDPGLPNDFLIDNLETAGKNFSSASDNGDGSSTDGADNTTAYYTPDLLSLLAVPTLG